ncbi:MULTISPECIES: nucleotidyltransferase [unclassified Enterococcus]|uniref:nucleotidyltransferase n=1 Tax=unclassified Enterococcus TaxID=2608891 RepID=UPI001552075E|nr:MULTISPECIES: nucleotidyltransferase [unclassified Enterococcus]MBS7576695.1 nucleotidyltransferase [Enterococcus sp. MMGLQ5-2]MBS7583818.1 nucleotidyltransferase [Enterococcus sp. MMGLQ5-1]NPD11679.1 nucleotidyltransferase [Enterococcus sp. MMGLQ5-1]NPD36532.1 nucleotidyltransferase [Enterococcus sp. MMGLQ5-2]
MKTVGIIVEYNPFHNGHLYHIEAAKRLTGADAVIAVMSGNFVQRGAPAIFDKWQRAEMALKNGVDLVVELPFASAVASADYFASGAIELLSALNCEAVCFGTDNQQLDYQKFGQLALINQDWIAKRLADLPDNLNYPAKMTVIWQALLGDRFVFNTPNHLLALSYAQANAKLKQPMRLIPILREKVAYHQLNRVDHLASATAIRQMTANNQFSQIQQVVPRNVWSYYQNGTPIFPETIFNLLKYRILSASLRELASIHQMKEGLEYKLKKVILTANSLDELIKGLKSKRYTYAYLSRLMSYILINVSDCEILAARKQGFIHILGFSKCGQDYLKVNKNQFKLPVLSKIGRDDVIYQLDLRVDAIYQLLAPKIPSQSFGRVPIRT